jgi:hypothetical protein
MNVWKDCLTFKIMDKTVHLYSGETSYGLSTVADIDNHFYYLGNKAGDITSAIFAWKAVNGRTLTVEEENQILIDNNLMSVGI